MSTLSNPIGILAPTHLELPCSDGKPVDNILQVWQGELLTNILSPWLDQLHPRGDYFVAYDVGIYWRLTQPELDGAIAPDWYYVPNVSRLRNGVPRRSYVMWVEGVTPLIAIEIVSRDGREEHNQTPESGKFWIYENVLQTPYLIIHSFETNELEIYQHVGGQYRRLELNAQRRILIPEMEVEFGLWEGRHRGYTARWLRAWDKKGQLFATSEEKQSQERQAKELAQDQAKKERQAKKLAQDKAEKERQAKELAQDKAAKLAEKLRELGIDPESIQ